MSRAKGLIYSLRFPIMGKVIREERIRLGLTSDFCSQISGIGDNYPELEVSGKLFGSFIPLFNLCNLAGMDKEKIKAAFMEDCSIGFDDFTRIGKKY